VVQQAMALSQGAARSRQLARRRRQFRLVVGMPAENLEEINQ